MNILFVSKDLIAGDLPYRLKKEGHHVKLFVESKESKKNLDNLVEKTSNWRKELQWVGKEGLIIFDDIGYGAIQDRLRDEGYTVFGGSELGEKTELDREFGKEIFTQCGLKTLPLKDFIDIRSAIEYVRENPDRWVIKQNDHGIKNLTYIGNLQSGADVIHVLEDYEKNALFHDRVITLQKRIDGVEMGVARYFNGTNWVGPVEINFEHTRLFPGDLGPTTSEMGTLAWYDNDNNKLFRETLAKLKPFLIRARFRGDFSINFILTKDGPFPLEATARIGTPIIHLQEDMHDSPMGEFLYAVASGKDYPLKWKKGFGIVVTLAVPPFPHLGKLSHSMYGTNIYFDPSLSKRDFEKIHFEEVSLMDGTKDRYFLSDSRGYVLYVTSIADSVEEVRMKVTNILNKITVPQSFYRNDIGVRFLIKDRKMLQDWGYLDNQIKSGSQRKLTETTKPQSAGSHKSPTAKRSVLNTSAKK